MKTNEEIFKEGLKLGEENIEKAKAKAVANAYEKIQARIFKLEKDLRAEKDNLAFLEEGKIKFENVGTQGIDYTNYTVTLADSQAGLNNHITFSL